MPTKKKKYNARFPPARIKKIMQMDEEVGKVAAPVPVIISRALELFVESLIHQSSATTHMRNARTLTTSHIKQTIISEKKYEFLKELVKNVSDIQPQEEESEKNREPSSVGPRPRGRPRKKRDEPCPPTKDRVVKRRGPRKKVEPVVVIEHEEKEVETDSGSDTDVADADENGENDCSVNEEEDEDDEETDTDVENEVHNVADMQIPAFSHGAGSSSALLATGCKPIAFDDGCSGDNLPIACHSGFTSLDNSAACHPSDTVAVRPYRGSARHSSMSEEMVTPLNLKIVPDHSAFASDLCPERASCGLLQQQTAMPMTGTDCDRHSSRMQSSVATDMTVNIPHQSATRTTGHLPMHSPGAMSNNTTTNPGFATHRMPPVLSLTMSTHVASSSRPLTPMPTYRTQDPLSMPLRLPSALNESNKFH